MSAVFDTEPLGLTNCACPAASNIADERTTNRKPTIERKGQSKCFGDGKRQSAAQLMDDDFEPVPDRAELRPLGAANSAASGYTVHS